MLKARVFDQEPMTSFLLVQQLNVLLPQLGGPRDSGRDLERPLSTAMIAWRIAKPEPERRTSATINCVHWTKAVHLLVICLASRAWLPPRKHLRDRRAAWLAAAKWLSRRQAC
ncbi:hypothetical protein [Thermogemmatispora tikiterensis]|uniref:Uncharacterized protein n=1 Tax=Thermogemmatispora tikiterensis TaxID=1825093 RepID=A0A328VB81_9CHLR|nr:hypothetical protein [Thermogemmatispora tikiterensis]RAQ94908.1 hypothetical protein A4R35_05120 [Thermogemmatispora tikiterensis]